MLRFEEAERRPLSIEVFREYQGIPVEYVTNNHALENPEARLLNFYAGLGEERRAAIRAMEIFDNLEMPASAVILPFHHLPPSRANLKRITVEVPQKFVTVQNLKSGRPENMPVDLVGSSQGGGAAIMMAGEAPDLFDAIAVKSPVGLNREAFGSEDTSAWIKRLKFMYRLGLKNSTFTDQWPIHIKEPHLDKGNLTGPFEVWRRVIDDAKDRRLYAKLDYALSICLAETVQQLSKNHWMRVFVGEKDPLFRLAEIQKSLGKVGCGDLVIPIKGASHSLIVSNAGARQITEIGEILKSAHPTTRAA